MWCPDKDICVIFSQQGFSQHVHLSSYYSSLLLSLNLMAWSHRDMSKVEGGRERTDWDSETSTIPLRYPQALRFMHKMLVLSQYRFAFLHSVWPQCESLLTYCHMCTYCVFSLCLFLSHSKHDRQPLPADGDSYYYSSNSIVSFSA